MEDAQNQLSVALDELNKTPPDNQAAVGNIEGAVGDLQAAVDAGLLDAAQGTQLMDQLAGKARVLAVTAIAEANADPSSDQSKINEAQASLAEWDTLRASGAFKDAVNQYKDGLAQAEGALP